MDGLEPMVNVLEVATKWLLTMMVAKTYGGSLPLLTGAMTLWKTCWLGSQRLLRCGGGDDWS